MKSSDYAKRYSDIKRYVNFRVSKNPTPSQKRMITRYHNALQAYGVIGQPQPDLFLFRSRSKKVQKAAINATRQEPGFPAIKVAIFRNVPIGAEVKARSVGGKVVFEKEGQFVKVRMFLFKDYEKFPGEFATDPEAVIKRVMKHCKGAHDTRFMCGKHLERTSSRKPGAILYTARNWIAKYGDESREPGQTWDQWWSGIEAIWHKNQRKEPRKPYGTKKQGKKAGNNRRRNRPVPVW